jgi:hypothetical protein
MRTNPHDAIAATVPESGRQAFAMAVEGMEWLEGMYGPEESDYIATLEALRAELALRIANFKTASGEA